MLQICFDKMYFVKGIASFIISLQNNPLKLCVCLCGSICFCLSVDVEQFIFGCWEVCQTVSI